MQVGTYTIENVDSVNLYVVQNRRFFREVFGTLDSINYAYERIRSTKL